VAAAVKPSRRLALTGTGNGRQEGTVVNARHNMDVNLAKRTVGRLFAGHADSPRSTLDKYRKEMAPKKEAPLAWP